MSLEVRKELTDVHASTVLCLAYNPLKREIWVGGEDGGIRVYDADAGKSIRSVYEHKGWVTGLIYIAESKLMLSCSLDGSIIFWATLVQSTHVEPIHVEAIKLPLYTMAWEPRKKLLYVGSNQALEVFTMTQDGSGPPKLARHTSVKSHKDYIRSICFADTRILTASYDRGVCIYDIDNPRKTTMVPNCHSAGICSLVYDPDNSWIVTGSFDRTLRVWSHDGKPLLKFSDFNDSVTGVCYVPATRTLWTVANAHHPQIYDPRTGTNISDFLPEKSFHRPRAIGAAEDDAQRFLRLFWVNETNELYGITASRSMVIWKYNPYAAVTVCREHTDAVECLTCIQTPGSIQLFSAGADSTVRSWEPMQLNTNLYTSEVMASFRSSALCCVYCEAVEHLVIGTEDAHIRLYPYDVVTDQKELLVEKTVYDEHTDRITGLAVLGPVLMSVSWDFTLRFFHLSDGVLLHTIKNAHDDVILGISCCPSRQEVATCGADKMAKIWNTETYKLRYALIGHTAEIAQVLWNEAMERWVTASDDCTIRLWDTEGTCLQVINTKTEPITAMCIDTVSGFIVAAARDRMIRVYDPVNNEIVQVHAGHQDEIRSVIHVKEYNQYISASWDGSIRIWNCHHQKGKAWHSMTREEQVQALLMGKKDVIDFQKRDDDDDINRQLTYADLHPIQAPKTLTRVSMNHTPIDKVISQDRKEKKRKKHAEKKKQQQESSALAIRLNELEAALGAKDQLRAAQQKNAQVLRGAPVPGAAGRRMGKRRGSVTTMLPPINTT